MTNRVISLSSSLIRTKVNEFKFIELQIKLIIIKINNLNIHYIDYD